MVTCLGTTSAFAGVHSTPKSRGGMASGTCFRRAKVTTAVRMSWEVAVGRERQGTLSENLVAVARGGVGSRCRREEEHQVRCTDGMHASSTGTCSGDMAVTHLADVHVGAALPGRCEEVAARCVHLRHDESLRSSSAMRGRGRWEAARR